jgi:hypothetical protein
MQSFTLGLQRTGKSLTRAQYVADGTSVQKISSFSLKYTAYLICLFIFEDELVADTLYYITWHNEDREVK